ncbi:MAG: MFS transporter [Acidiferrobacteraceae bacterium]
MNRGGPATLPTVITVYGAGFLQGCAFVLIPALGRIFSARPYHWNHTAYGLLYLPEMAGAILSALGAGEIAGRFGIRGVFRIGAGANALAMGMLAMAFVAHGRLAYGLVMVESGCLGAGFGLTLAAANDYAGRLYPASATVAVTLLNALIGAATALSPLILHVVARLGHWGWWPAILTAAFVFVAFGPLPAQERVRATRESWHRGMFLFALAVLLYAICEGSFGSWADLYISVDRGQGARYGALALSVFWGTMTAFRLLLALIPERWVSRRVFFLAAPIGIGVCFAAIPFLVHSGPLVAIFGAAGAACSIYYPFAMAFGLAAYPGQPTRIAGLIVAALMAGEGIGSFGLGPLQTLIPLSRIYLFSAAWAIPLTGLAWIIVQHERTSPDVH